MLFSIFLFIILISKNKKFSKKIKKNKKTKQKPYIKTKTKPHSLHQSNIPQKNNNIFYINNKPKNIITNNQLQIITSHPIKKLPNILIINIKKSKTKTLIKFLKIHPNINTPTNKIHYFNKNFHKNLN